MGHPPHVNVSYFFFREKLVQEEVAYGLMLERAGKAPFAVGLVQLLSEAGFPADLLLAMRQFDVQNAAWDLSAGSRDLWYAVHGCAHLHEVRRERPPASYVFLKEHA